MLMDRTAVVKLRLLAIPTLPVQPQTRQTLQTPQVLKLYIVIALNPKPYLSWALH